jgi:signal transduction histidine kinase
MDDAIEKIGYYVIGAMCGLSVGFIILSLNVPFLQNKDPYLFQIITILAGILLSFNFLMYKKERMYIENKKIHNETVALITHEMRTGLTETGWAIEATLENYKGVLKEEDVKMLGGVLKSINTTVMHTVNLLDTSLMDIGKLSIALKWMKLSDVEDVFKESLNRYKVAAQKAGIVLTYNMNLDGGKQVEVDILRLRVTLENLLENSIQYASDDADKKINVEARNDQSFLYITVKDNGIGIPDEEHKHIFSEFFRATNARKRIRTGSGIGLNMSYQCVKAHHGTITFESKEGEGTTFFITLPLKSAASLDEFLNNI